MFKAIVITFVITSLMFLLIMEAQRAKRAEEEAEEMRREKEKAENRLMSELFRDTAKRDVIRVERRIKKEKPPEEKSGKHERMVKPTAGNGIVLDNTLVASGPAPTATLTGNVDENKAEAVKDEYWKNYTAPAGGTK